MHELVFCFAVFIFYSMFLVSHGAPPSTPFFNDLLCMTWYLSRGPSLYRST